MSYIFQTFSFDTRDQMLDAMIAWYWTCDGHQPPEAVDAALDQLAAHDIDPARQTADDLTQQLGLNERPVRFDWEEPEMSHMEKHRYNHDDLIEAAHRFLATRPDKIEDASE